MQLNDSFFFSLIAYGAILSMLYTHTQLIFSKFEINRAKKLLENTDDMDFDRN